MRIFLTGATGFVGSRIVPDLIAAGHQVLGLARSDKSARALEEAGAEVQRGTLEEPETVARGAAVSDAVIHTAFDHDFSRFAENAQKDGRVIEAIGAELAGSDRPFLITSGTGMGNSSPGELATEKVFDRDNPNPRRLSELVAERLMERGISIAVVRLPQVHNLEKQGLISPAIGIARAKNLSAYVGDGTNRWPGAHVDDVARLYRLALEAHTPGARWHAVGEEGISFREIAETIGAGLDIPVRSLSPEEAAGHFDWLAPFAAMDMPASSASTRAQLGWEPTGPGLLEDLRRMDFGRAAA